MSPTTLSRTHTHTPTPFTPYSSRRPSAASHVSKASSHRSIRCNGNNNDDASSVCSFASTMTAAQDEPEWIGAPLLPNEVIDLILDALFTCPIHPWASRHKPCTAWHTDSTRPNERSQYASLLPLRLVNRSFHRRLTPILFQHMTCRSPQHRHRMLLHFSQEKHLTPLIRVLRIEVAPADLGARMRRVTQNAVLPADRKLAHYFEMLRVVLAPVLKKFVAVQTLHVTTSYAGMPEKRLPKVEVLPQCFDALAESIRKASLENLEEVMLGMPYEGGWTDFFSDLEDKRYELGLRRCGKNVRTASVKLIDHKNSFITMPFF